MNFSVIVPTYNRVSSLRKTIESLLALDYRDCEIIVVDDGSEDGTTDFLADVAERHGIVALRQENRGPAAARNAGIRRARGRWIAFTDDDCVVPSGWLKTFERAFGVSRAAFVGGAVQNICPGNFFAETIQEMTSFFVAYLSARGRYDFLTSNNIAYDAEQLKAAGGFDERFPAAGGEERALNHAILRDGSTALFLPELMVGHCHAMTAAGFFRQQFNYGRGALVLQRLAGRGSAVPLFAHLSLCFSWLTRNPLRGAAKCALYAVAQCASLAGYFRQLAGAAA